MSYNKNSEKEKFRNLKWSNFYTREFKASSRRLPSNDTKHNKWFESHLLAMFLRVDGIDFPFDM